MGKKEILKYRIYRLSLILGIVAIIAVTIFHTSFLFNIVAVAAVIFSIWVQTKLLTQAQRKIFKTWIVILNERLSTFPLNKAEQKKFADWALKKLKGLATEATRAARCRNWAREALEDASTFSPKDIGSMRRDIREKTAYLEQAVKQETYAFWKYHAAWDVLVKPFPEGIGILYDLAWLRDENPDAFREKVESDRA
jgi:hypothetical protein